MAKVKVAYKCSEEFFYDIEGMSTKNSFKGFVEMDKFNKEKLRKYCIQKHNLNEGVDGWEIVVIGKKIDKI